MSDDDLEEIDENVNQIIENIELDGQATLTQGDLRWLRNVIDLVQMHSE